MVCIGEIVFPSLSRRPSIIREYHESVVGGHQGMTKLFKRIREDFYWLKMEQEITAFVRSCSSCQRNKILFAKTKQPMRITDTPQKAFKKLQMDIVGPLPSEFSRQEIPRTFVEHLDELFTKITTTQTTAALNYCKML